MSVDMAFGYLNFGNSTTQISAEIRIIVHRTIATVSTPVHTHECIREVNCRDVRLYQVYLETVHHDEES